MRCLLQVLYVGKLPEKNTVYKLRTVMAREGKALCWELFKTNTAEESFLIQVGQLETAWYVLRSCDGREVRALG